MIIVRAEGLPGSGQGASINTEFYFDDNAAIDAIAKIGVDQLSQVGGSVYSPRTGLSGAVPTLANTRVRPFLVRAGGIVVGSAASNFTINLDAGDSTTISSNTTIATSGAIALDTDDTLTTWYIEANLMLAPGVTSKLQGRFSGWVNNTVTAAAIAVESVEDVLSLGQLAFKVSGTFATADDNHRAVCNFLEIVLL